jgi:hypothetical protein
MYALSESTKYGQVPVVHAYNPSYLEG